MIILEIIAYIIGFAIGSSLFFYFLDKKEEYANKVLDLLKVESFHHYVLEPACGGGFISQPLMDNGYDVLSTDLIDRGFGNGNIDFLTSEFEKGKYEELPKLDLYQKLSFIHTPKS